MSVYAITFPTHKAKLAMVAQRLIFIMNEEEVQLGEEEGRAVQVPLYMIVFLSILIF